MCAGSYRTRLLILCVCGARGIKYKKLRRRRQELDAREAAARVSDMERGVEGPRRPARVCREPRAKVSRYPIRDTTHRCSMVVRKISRGHTGDPATGDRDPLLKVWVNYISKKITVRARLVYV